eukprot:1451961-Rhodomonas_salina.1
MAASVPLQLRSLICEESGLSEHSNYTEHMRAIDARKRSECTAYFRVAFMAVSMLSPDNREKKSETEHVHAGPVGTGHP